MKLLRLSLSLTALFPGKSKSVSTDVLETFKRQAECLLMPSPRMMEPNSGENFNWFFCLRMLSECHTELLVLWLIFNVNVNRNLPRQHPAVRGAQCPQLPIRGQGGTSNCKTPGYSFWLDCELIYTWFLFVPLVVLCKIFFFPMTRVYNQKLTILKWRNYFIFSLISDHSTSLILSTWWLWR